MSHNRTLFTHLRRTPYQSLSAIFLMITTFFMVSTFALVVAGTQRLLLYFESRPQVTAFFRDDATESQIDQLKSTLSQQVMVESTQYLSKADALQIYREQNSDNPLLLEMVTADILPASLEVSAKSASDLEKIAQLMQTQTFVEEVVFQKDIIDTLRQWITGIRLGGLILTSLLLFASLTTVMVILGLKFTARKTEIKTLALLGATSWYIRRPFVLEGIFYGVVGSLVGWGIAYLCLLYLTPNLIAFLQGISLLPAPPLLMLALLGGEVALGVGIGGLASWLATRRYGR